MKMRKFVLVASGAALFSGISFMQLVVKDASAQDSSARDRGQAVYNNWCTPCHAPGPGHPGTQSLEIKYRDVKITPVLEQRDDLTPEFVQTIVRQGIMSMAPFRKTEISDASLDDIAAYLSKSGG